MIGQKNTKVFWHQSEARTGLTVWNWSVKTLSPGALLCVLDFSSPEFFFARFRLFPVPTNCPWVSEDEVWFEVFHYSSDERIIEIITEIKFAIKNLLIHSWEERLTSFDCKVCLGSKFTSSAEGRRFNWLIYDSMISLFACGRFSKSRGLSASGSSLPSPFPFPSFTHSIHRPVILCSRTAQKRLLRRLD